MRRKTFLIPVLLTGLSFLLAFTPGDKEASDKHHKPDYRAPDPSVRLSKYASLSRFEQESLFPFEKWRLIKERAARASACPTPDRRLAPSVYYYYWDFIGTTLLDEYNPEKYIMPWCQEQPVPWSCNEVPFNNCTPYYNGKRICKIKAQAACGTMDPECFHPDLSSTILTWYKTQP